jgi:hypothetical protein
MPRDVDADRVLNVFRELESPHDETLTTDDLVEERPVKKRAVQKYVRELEQDDRLVVAVEGKPNHWRLPEIEPTDPVYDRRLGKAKRLGNQARKVGDWLFLGGVAVLASVGLVMSNQRMADLFGVQFPLVGSTDPLAAAIIGFFGSFAFLTSFLAYVTAIALPRIVKWWIEDPLPSR